VKKRALKLNYKLVQIEGHVFDNGNHS